MRIVFVICIILFSELAAAVPIQTIRPVSQPALLFIQENRGSGWFSPEGISPDFPRLSPRDCARYGAEYGYAECGTIRKKAASAVEPAPANIATSNAPPRKTPATKNARSKPLDDAKEILTGKAGSNGEAQSVKTLVGRVLLARFQGLTAKDQSVTRIGKALRDKRLAGLVFQPANITNAAQLKELVSGLGKSEAGALRPLLALEQPGGLDAALAEEKGFTFYAAPNLIARQQSAYDAQLVYSDMARELSGLGFNLNIGPNADPCPELETALSARCFSGAPSTVAAFTAAFNFAHHDIGVLTATRRVHKPRTAPAFVKMPGVMMMRDLAKRQPADAIVVQIDPDSILKPEPALARDGQDSSAATAVFGVAGFDGAVIGDLDPAGSGVPLRLGEAAIRAFEGGADAVLLPETVSSNNESLTLVMDAVEKAISSGRLTLSRLQESAQKVDAMRARLSPLAAKADAKVAQREVRPASALARP